MKILMMTDLEGVAGYVSFDYDQSSRNNEQGRHLLTAEVNAAVEGMIEAGADDFLVFDWHGPGAIHYPDLHEAARLVHGRPVAPASVRRELFVGFDAAVMIGQHAMAGIQRGNLSHTQSSQSIESYTLNGRPIGEIGQWALYVGSLGIPLIFISGDEAACAEATALAPGLTSAAVKQGLSRNSAVSLAHPTACRLIRERSHAAVAAHRVKPLPPVRWPGPYVLEKRFFHTDAVDYMYDNPNIEIIDSLTVRLRADSLEDIVYA